MMRLLVQIQSYKVSVNFSSVFFCTSLQLLANIALSALQIYTHMKLLPVPKENVSPHSSSVEYCLRKSIPLKLSSILKSSNTLPNNRTLAQVTALYQSDQLKIKKHFINAPLIKINQEKSKAINLFTKNSRNSIKLPFEKPLISKCQQHSKTPQNPCNQEEKLSLKLMHLIQMITPQDKIKLNRCHSSITLNLGVPLINKNASKTSEQIPLPLPNEKCDFPAQQSGYVRVARPSFMFKAGEKARCSEPVQQPVRSQLTKSSYFQGPQNFRLNEQRMSHYQPVSKIEKPQLRLCINCESYVNTNAVSQHQKQCLGFNIILKMSSSELIDFLNQKITDKLNQLKQAQSKIISHQNSCPQIDPIERQNLCQERAKIDQILNDLDAIRLKALKRFHTKNHIKTQAK